MVSIGNCEALYMVRLFNIKFQEKVITSLHISALCNGQTVLESLAVLLAG